MQINIKTIVRLTFTTLVVGGLSFYFAYKAKSEPSSMSFRPYMAERVENQWAPPTAPAPVVTHDTFARRNDGSKVHIFPTTSPEGESGQAVEIADYRRGKYMSLEPFTKSVTTMYLSDRQIAHRQQLEKGCGPDVNSASARHARILGYDAVWVASEMTPTNKQDSLVAPALDCVALKENITIPGVRVERTITTLVEAEPPESIFEIPQGFIERSPAQVETAYELKFGKPYWGNGKMLTLMEQRYSSSRK